MFTKYVNSVDELPRLRWNWVDGKRLNRLINGSLVIGLWSTKNEESKGISDFFTEFLILLGFVSSDGSLNVIVDLNSVDNDVLSSVVGERNWAREDGGHFTELFDVSYDTRAIFHHVGNGNNGVTEFFKTFGSSVSCPLLEVSNSIFHVTEQMATIFEASFDVVKTLGVESTNEDTLSNLSEFGQVVFLLGCRSASG